MTKYILIGLLFIMGCMESYVQAKEYRNINEVLMDYKPRYTMPMVYPQQRNNTGSPVIITNKPGNTYVYDRYGKYLGTAQGWGGVGNMTTWWPAGGGKLSTCYTAGAFATCY
jgi:hypothetical protein